MVNKLTTLKQLNLTILQKVLLADIQAEKNVWKKSKIQLSKDLETCFYTIQTALEKLVDLKLIEQVGEHPTNKAKYYKALLKW